MFARLAEVDGGSSSPSDRACGVDARGCGVPDGGTVGSTVGLMVAPEGLPACPDEQASWLCLDPHGDDWWAPDALAEMAVLAVPPAVAPPGCEASGGGGGDEQSGFSSPAWWESAECVERLDPGPGLAQVLEVVDPARLTDAALVEAVAAAERLAAWAHLQAALLAGALSRRGSMNPDWNAPVPTRRGVAGDELAMRLGWSRPAANRLVRDGQALDNELLLVADAVREGQVDTPKLRVLTDRLADRPGQLAWAVQEAVLPSASTRTPSQLAADVDRAILQVEPEDAAIRLPKAIAARRVCHPRRLPDGMAGLWAVLPALDAARIDGTLEATARAARAAGDPRTLDQLRADALTDLATGAALLAGTARAAGEADAAPATRGTPDHSRAALGAPGALGADHGAPEALGADRGAPEAPGADHGAPDAARATCGEAEGFAARSEADERGEPLECLEVNPPGRRAPGIRIPKVRIDVTVALSTLLGLDDEPGELAGLGPIPAEQARALAAGGTWRRLVTDPLTGAVLDVGRTRYRPPRSIAEHVLARDQVCAAPGCGVPGHRCDLDHTTEYHGTPANGSPVPGTTSAANLGPLSERCHRLKTDGGFTLTQVAPGVFEWRTPAGLGYRVTPGDGGRTERLGPKRDRPNPGYPDEPPF